MTSLSHACHVYVSRELFLAAVCVHVFNMYTYTTLVQSLK